MSNHQRRLYLIKSILVIGSVVVTASCSGAVAPTTNFEAPTISPAPTGLQPELPSRTALCEVIGGDIASQVLGLEINEEPARTSNAGSDNTCEIFSVPVERGPRAIVTYGVSVTARAAGLAEVQARAMRNFSEGCAADGQTVVAVPFDGIARPAVLVRCSVVDSESFVQNLIVECSGYTLRVGVSAPPETVDQRWPTLLKIDSDAICSAP